MSMSRYKGTSKFINSEEYYEYLRRERDLKSVEHYATPILKNPSIGDRMTVIADQRVWKYGDRLYKLAHQYYGHSRYWWVIAWYNGQPTEAHFRPGDLVQIPISLSDAYSALGL
jgi:hypothetical protein